MKLECVNREMQQSATIGICPGAAAVTAANATITTSGTGTGGVGGGSNVAKPSSTSCSSSPSPQPPPPPSQQQPPSSSPPPTTKTSIETTSSSSSSSMPVSNTPTSIMDQSSASKRTGTVTGTSKVVPTTTTGTSSNITIPTMKNQQPPVATSVSLPTPPPPQQQAHSTTGPMVETMPRQPQHQQFTTASHQQHQQQQHPQPHQHQPPPVTTTAAQAVITVVAPSTQATPVSGFSQQQSKCNLDMIPPQPLMVQVSSGSNQYITVASSNEHTVVPPQAHQQNTLKLEDGDTDGQPQQQPPHAYEDYNAVFSNGSNSAGQMTYYVSESYSSGYYNTGVPEAYLVMDQQPPSSAAVVAAATHDQIANQTISNNGLIPHRDTNQNVISDEDYTKPYQSSTARMAVQPQTVQWLTQNYETADGVSLPRSTLYTHYQQHCQQHNIEPVNAASFGKLIRSVFVGLRTRRLGTRGNSKYHYYGIRVRPGSALSDGTNGSVENSTMPPVKRLKSNSKNNNNNNSNNNSQNQNPATITVANTNTNNNHGNINDIHSVTASKEVLQSYLGNVRDIWNSLDFLWPSTNQSDSNGLTDHSQKLLNIFFKIYRTHYERIISALSELNFHEIEHIWMAFWQPNSVDNQESLSIQCLKDLIKNNHCTVWIAQTDYTMYNSIISNLLLPNLLKPIPQVLTQQIRNFAKCINKWMANALQGYPEEFIRIKTSAVSALSHMLRRYTSLNHLSTAACAVLKNSQQVAQMINDLNKVDFKNVQEQASWVCQCDEQTVHQVENSFKMFLQECNPYERWADWCQQVLNMSLPNHNITTAKQFFFKWEFYSSLVMRDLTLRSAQSFGSFHLIRLLFDEYIFYLVEQQIAKATNTTPLQMLGEVSQFRHRS